MEDTPELATGSEGSALRSLSYADRWRVVASVRKGVAPADPRLMAGAAEWARSYLRSGHPRAIDVMTAIGLVVFPAVFVFALIRGSILVAITTGVIILVHLAQVALTPVFRTGNVRQALEDCERALGQSVGA